MTKPKFKKGQWCAVHTRAYDCWPAGWRLVRIVKVDRVGLITHVVKENSWTDAVKANAGNNLKANFVFAPVITDNLNPHKKHTFTVGEYADYDLSDIHEHIFPTLGELKSAIVYGIEE